MKKLCSLLLVLLLCVSLFTGCAVKEDPVHPPKYSMLAPLMHRPLEEFYKETGLTEEELVKKGVVHYELPEAVTFRDLPFTVSIYTDPINGYFVNFYYSSVLTGSDEEKAETVLALAQYFTDALGRSQHTCAYGAVGKSNRIAEMSASELAAHFSSGKLYNAYDYWSLGNPDEASIQDYKMILESSGKPHIPDPSAVPVIKFGIELTSDPVRGEQIVGLVYSISYWWETVDDDFFNSLPGH